MISLRKTATELERLEELHRTAVNCYSQALRSTELNAIELDTAQAAHFRTQLHTLGEQLRSVAGPRDLESVQRSFETALKDYRDKTGEQIQKLRREVQAAAAAVESFAGSINESEVNLESGLKRELNGLNQTAASDDIQVIRGAIRASTTKIAASIQQMRSSNQLAIAQLKDEIRLLHQEVQASRRSTAPDPSAESQQRINGRMEEYIKKNTPFSVLLVVVRNLEGLQNCYSAQIIDSALRGFQSRFENIFPSSATVGRWAKDQFAALLSTAPGNAIDMSSEVVRKLSEPFVEQENGGKHSIVFNPRAGVIEFGSGSDLVKFQARLKQLADALAG
ncbi:MAG TPA: GGDEF domain-containing protein [Bryobacteraceae bacterium]|jgi:GGDEF domain-containing protein|nr:GGDEF domain-containing protein [Bryobacteraceae bacterium]